MRQYEIRILNGGNALALAMNGLYLTDSHAIRTAQTLRRRHEHAQVWCDDQCIYRDGAAATPPPHAA